jgi:hypothetical protein
VFAVAAIFGLPLFISGAMVMPEGLHLGGLITYTLIMLVLMPFGGGWLVLATQFALPTAGRTRLGAVLNTWIGGTLLAVAVTFWLASVVSYDPSGSRIDWSAHVLIPYMPRTGIALGLFMFCQLVAWGVVGAIAPILRPETAISSAVVAGITLFILLYAAGWFLVTT